MTELALAEDKWPHPEDHVLPIQISPTATDEIPDYLKAVTIAFPHGNAVAHTAAIVQDGASGSWMQKTSLLAVASRQQGDAGRRLAEEVRENLGRTLGDLFARAEQLHQTRTLQVAEATQSSAGELLLRFGLQLPRFESRLRAEVTPHGDVWRSISPGTRTFVSGTTPKPSGMLSVVTLLQLAWLSTPAKIGADSPYSPRCPVCPIRTEGRQLQAVSGWVMKDLNLQPTD